MDFYIIIPCYNEAKHIGKTLASICEQTLLPKKIVVVNDNSTDKSAEVVSAFAKAYSFIKLVHTHTKGSHEPGSKVIRAFQQGVDTLDDNYDIICKFDADLVFPKNYLQTIADHFKKDPKVGMAGGFCYIQKNGEWILENLTNKDHIRGALKAYRKACFQDIGGLKPAMGWDTVDELLAKYHNWKIVTDQNLSIKHLKPTGNTYTKASKFRQGEAFYVMRYGFWLTVIASLKLALRKQKITFFFHYIQGFLKARKKQKTYLVNEKEGTFIRNLRWKGIRKRLF